MYKVIEQEAKKALYSGDVHEQFVKNVNQLAIFQNLNQRLIPQLTKFGMFPVLIADFLQIIC